MLLHAPRQPASWLTCNVRQKMRALLLVLLCFSGCAHIATQGISAARLPGVYRNGDGFWPRWLDLKEDGTFSYTQMTDVLKSVGDDQFVCEGGWAFSGRWMFVAPDKIELTTDGKPEKIAVFVRHSKKYEISILEPDLFSDILSTWTDDGGLRYLKKERPNQSPEPTPTTGTSAAEQPLVPAVVVAHL